MSAAEDIWDDAAVARTIAAKIRAIMEVDLSAVLSDVGEIGQLDSIRRIQSTKVDPAGGAWAAWSAAYARSGRGRSLLRLSGDLMGAVDHRPVGNATVMLRAETPYAARQHHGFRGRDSRGRSVNHPARPFLGLSESAQGEVGAVVAQHIVRAFREAV